MALDLYVANHISSEVVYRVTISIPTSLQSYFKFKYTDGRDYWIKKAIDATRPTDTVTLEGQSYSDYSPPVDKATIADDGYYYPARFYYDSNSSTLYLEITKNSDRWHKAVNIFPAGYNSNPLLNDWKSFTIENFSLADLLTVKSGYTVSPSLSNVTVGTLTVGSVYTISGITAYKQVSTNKILAFPSKDYYSFKSGINNLVKNNFSFQYTSGGSTTTLNSSYITVSDVSGSQYNKAVTIAYNVPNPATTIATDFANGVLVPNTGVKLSTFYNTVAYNMASLNVAVTLTKSGNTFTVNSLPNPIWQYISSFALNVPVQAGGFSGTCTAFAQTGPFVNNYTVSYSGTITTWNQSVTSSMNQVCSISYSYQVSGNNTSSSKTFTVDRYYGYVTSSTHLRMGVNFTGSSSLLYQSTAPTVEQLSSTSEIRSVTRI